MIKDDPRRPELGEGKGGPGGQFPRGGVAFAGSGENSRTSQLFITFRDGAVGKMPWENQIGTIIEGMDVVDSFYKGYGDMEMFNKGGVSPQKLEMQGIKYVHVRDGLNSSVFWHRINFWCLLMCRTTSQSSRFSRSAKWNQCPLSSSRCPRSSPPNSRTRCAYSFAAAAETPARQLNPCALCFFNHRVTQICTSSGWRRRRTSTSRRASSRRARK